MKEKLKMPEMTVTIRYEKRLQMHRHRDLKRKNCRLSEREDINVYIYSGQWQSFWRPNGGGYTNDLNQAGVYTLADAWNRTSHCGPEKDIRYLRVPEGELKPQ